MAHKNLLLISHNAFSDTKSNGKILSTLFREWPSDKISQLYFWNEFPSGSVCDRFYRLRDHDILKGNLTGTRAIGTVIDRQAINGPAPAHSDAKPAGPLASAVQWAFTKKMPIAEAIRDIMWRKSKYISDDLLKWLDESRPEIVFLLGGPISFAYRISLWICGRYGAELNVLITDDVTFVRNRMSPFAWINYARHRKWFARSLEKSTATYVIVPAMKKEFEHKHKCSNVVLALNSFDLLPLDEGEDASSGVLRLLYAGNVGLNRWQTLRKLGLCLAELEKDGYRAKLEIFSPTPISDKMKKALTVENAMSYNGSLNPEQLRDAIKRSNVLVHVESFRRKYRRITRLSLSTKIAESLIAGRCLLAIGPEDVSSMEYLKDNDAAHIINDTQRDAMKEALTPLFSAEYRRATAKRAYEVAAENHDADKMRKTVYENIHRQK